MANPDDSTGAHPAARRADRSTRSAIETLLAAEEAGAAVGESVARWWGQLGLAADKVVAGNSLDELFRHALATMREALGTDAVSVLLANEDEDELIARAAVGLDEEVSLELQIRSGEGMAGRVLASRKPLVVRDLSQIQLASPALITSGMRSVVAVPILLDDRVLGVLHAGSHQLDRFTDVDARMLEQVAERMAGALGRIQLFETERLARLRAEQIADRLARLQTITSLLAGASSPAEVATILAAAMSSNGPNSELDRGDVWLVHDEPPRLVRTAEEPLGSGEFDEIAVDADVPAAVVYRTNEPAYVASTRDAEAMFPVWSQGRQAKTAFAVLPLLIKEECVGILALMYPGEHRFELDEREFLATVVDQASQAIDKARLYEEQAKLATVSAFLANAAKVMAEAPDFQDALDRLATLALAVLGDLCLIDVLDDNESLQRMVARHRDPGRQHLVDELHSRYPPDAGGQHPAAGVVRTGRPRWSSHMSDDFLRSTTHDDAHFRLTQALEFRSYLTVPLADDEDVIGTITFVSASRSFGGQDVTFAQQLAQQVAAVVANAQRFERADRTAHVLQESLLPERPPEVPGVRTATRYLPSTRGLNVGGDFYDLVVLPSQRLGFMIGDVAGHDRSAAAMMGQLRSAARALAGQVDSPGELVAALKWSWGLLGFERLATGLFGELDPTTGELTLASAGHHPPLMIEAGASHYLPVPPASPFGAPETETGEWHGVIRPGQSLLIYTDGVIDDRGVGAQASMDRLARIVAAGDVEPQAVCQRVIDGLTTERVDDVALLALALEPLTPS
ncbi:MAG TPA: GAF domain-containing protein [Acidimicrobiales bacterium]|nr:GAF domain-containing protein [Acidimicrobiales bacterium]